MSCSFSKQTHGLNALFYQTHLLCQEECYRLSIGPSFFLYTSILYNYLNYFLCSYIKPELTGGKKEKKKEEKKKGQKVRYKKGGEVKKITKHT